MNITTKIYSSPSVTQGLVVILIDGVPYLSIIVGGTPSIWDNVKWVEVPLFTRGEEANDNTIPPSG